MCAVTIIHECKSFCHRNGLSVSPAPAKLPPPLPADTVKALGQTFDMYKLDMNQPPPVPPTRPYTVQGDIKISFPQFRVMKQNYKGKTSSAQALILMT